MVTISYKKEDLLIEELKKQKNIEVLKKSSFLKNLFGKKKYANVYFHSGNLDKKAILNIKNSELSIVNSNSIKTKILEKMKINTQKIDVIYPSINAKSETFEKQQEIKDNFFKEFNIELNTRLIFFTAKNFKTSGIKEFLDICLDLNYKNIKLIIAGDKKQIINLQFLLSKYKKFENKIILLEDYKNINELFLISDIFLLPTHNKTFSLNILKAMFYENVVFLSAKNDASEVIDTFATLCSPTDITTAFKIDAILNSNKELKKIKEENNKIAQKYGIEVNLSKINKILENLNLVSENQDKIPEYFSL